MTHQEPNADERRDAAPSPTDRRARWLKYGSSVAVLIVAVGAIVVMVNYLGYHYYQRFDFTETRQYSLSEQTLSLLEQLDADVEVTTLYAEGTAEPELFQRVQDLLAEYQRRSGRIRAEQIDPTIHRERFLAYIDELSARFEEEVRANRAAVEGMHETFAEIRRFSNRQIEQIAEVLPMLGPEEELMAMVLPELNRVYMRIDDDLREYEQEIEQVMGEELPDFAAARALAKEPVRDLSERILEVAVERFDTALEDPATSDAVEDALLGMRREYRALLDSLGEVRQELAAVEAPGYDRLREAVGQTNSLVVAMDAEAAAEREDRGLIVLGLEEIYPNLLPAQLGQGEVRPEQGYKGEEVVSSAIMQMTVEHDTKVVFLNPSPQPVLAEGHPSTTYRLAAERLEQMNFTVREWQPEGGVGPDGRPTQAGSRPTAEPGQTMVFVALPAPPDQQQQAPARNGEEEPVGLRVIRDRVASGEPTLVVLSAQDPRRVGVSNPVHEPLAELGIEVDASRVAMRQTAAAGGRVQGTTQMVLSEWPEGHRLTEALAGLQGLLLQGVYLDLDGGGEEVRTWPLVEAPSDAWAGRDFIQAAAAEPGEEDPRGPFAVAAAAERGEQRVVVIGDRAFAADMVAQSGPQNMFGQVMYSQFPANQELLVNSVYWLAGMDDLIAPGARTQDVRRIAAVSRSQMAAARWGLLAGLPLACLVAGLGVWLVRRQ